MRPMVTGRNGRRRGYGHARGALWDGPDRCDGGRGRYGRHGCGGLCMGTRQNIGIVGGVERGRLNKGPAQCARAGHEPRTNFHLYNILGFNLGLSSLGGFLHYSVALFHCYYYHIAYIYIVIGSLSVYLSVILIFLWSRETVSFIYMTSQTDHEVYDTACVTVPYLYITAIS
ncbi:hypothetical protein EDB85DRAFT_1982073, partial [Lactarius pseudohatsudake]